MKITILQAPNKGEYPVDDIRLVAVIEDENYKVKAEYPIANDFDGLEAAARDFSNRLMVSIKKLKGRYGDSI